MPGRTKEESSENRNASQLIHTARIMQKWAQRILRVADSMKHEKISVLPISRKSSQKELERYAKSWGMACEDALEEYYEKLANEHDAIDVTNSVSEENSEDAYVPPEDEK